MGHIYMLKMSVNVFNVVLTLGVFFCSCLAECPDGWVTNDDSCYLFDHSLLTFKEAEALCTQEASHLVEIETDEENDFISKFGGFLKSPAYWIGLTDEAVEHSWMWLNSNTAANYTSWYKGRPNGQRARNCAEMIAAYGFAWFDTACTTAHAAICERRRLNQIAQATEVIG